MEGGGSMRVVTYRFAFKTGVEWQHEVKIDPTTLVLIPTDRTEYPSWAQLSYHQCPNCPLSQENCATCPVAGRIAELIDSYRDAPPSGPADVTVITPERAYYKSDALQEGLSSLIGLIMVTAGCPVLEKLRPMVATHLPFATTEETTYRAVSMYLMAQYFVKHHGKKPDWTLKKLVEIYANIRTVNQAFAKRVAGIEPRDPHLNSLVKLDCFATAVTLSIVGDWWDDVESFFEPFLRRSPE